MSSGLEPFPAMEVRVNENRGKTKSSSKWKKKMFHRYYVFVKS